METALTSLGVYVLIDLISLVVIYKYRHKFLQVLRVHARRLGIQPIYHTHTYPVIERIQTPALHELPNHGNVLNFNEETDEEELEDEELDYGWGYEGEDEDEDEDE